MTAVHVPDDIMFNTAAVTDPAGFVESTGARSWLYLCGPEFESMDNGLSYAQVQASVAESENIISDPPRVLGVDLARQHVAALDRLRRPTVVTCRVGPRASAVVYLYAGLRAGASVEEVLALADADSAPFATFPEYRAFVADSLAALSSEESTETVPA